MNKRLIASDFGLPMIDRRNIRIWAFAGALALWVLACAFTPVGHSVQRGVAFSVPFLVRALGVPCGFDGSTLYGPRVVFSLAPPFDGGFAVGLGLAFAATAAVRPLKRCVFLALLPLTAFLANIVFMGLIIVGTVGGSRTLSLINMAVVATLSILLVGVVAGIWVKDIAGSITNDP